MPQGPVRRGAPHAGLHRRASATPWRPPWSSGPAWWSSAAGCWAASSPAAWASSAIVAMFPLLRSLGPLPGNTLDETNWRKGTRLVDSTAGRSTRTTSSRAGSSPSSRRAYQNNDNGQAIDQTVLIRVPADRPGHREGPGDAGARQGTWPTPSCAPTSAARSASTSRSSSCWCARATSRCSTSVTAPCPQFGPAPRPLPQLPLYIDRGGYLRAQAGYDQPVGPGFWERTTGNGQR